MILIADSGSTKTDWRLVDGLNVTSISTIGFNPYHISSNQIYDELNSKEELKEISNSVSHIYFYGAGCSTTEKKEIISKALSSFFCNAKIEVEHDMLAAARATCGNEAGITAILGTGSNSCVYDGENIVENIPALGYILGDEGGGVDIGKALIKLYLNKELPENLINEFENEYSYRLNSILNSIYNKPLPNRFLAQFAKFVKKYENEPILDSFVKNSFRNFFDLTICKYLNHKEYKLYFVGSIGDVFQKQLYFVAEEKGLKIEKIIKTPIEELVSFHTSV